MNRENRIEWVDEWKGMLILLVVLGHIVGGMCHYTSGDANSILRYAYKFIYLFHMPAFFMVAGYLWKWKQDVSIGNVVKHRIDRLVVPYFIWGILSAVIFIGMESIARMLIEGSRWYYGERMFEFPWWRPFVSILHAGDWPNGEGFRCNSVLWFLPCMFVVLMTYDGLERLMRKMRGLASEFWSDICLVVIFVVLGAVVRLYAPKYLPWGLSRAPYMMIFFVIGRLLSRVNLTEKFKVPMLAVAVGWIAYGYAAWKYPDLAVGYMSWKWYWCTVMLAIAGCLLSLYTVMAWRICFLARLGVASMGIMLTHKFFIMPIQLCYGKFAHFGDEAVIIMVIATLVIVSSMAYGVTVAIRRFAPLMVGERK